MAAVGQLPVTSLSEAKPIQVEYHQVSGQSLYLTEIDLTDPDMFLSIGLAHNASQANSARSSKGDERFLQMVRRHKAALTASGTFFSMDAQKRVMGNMVAKGTFLKFSPWENYGTTLGIRSGNRPEMITARVEGKPKWDEHWFSITAGPRLLKNGQIWLNPKKEGFTDRSMMEGKALRSAIGFPAHGRTLLLVTFMTPTTLQKEAQIMRDLGCQEAMNLDGGTSVALAKGGKILKSPGRKLTNVITVYDVNHPAPEPLRQSWRDFQRNRLLAQRQDQPQDKLQQDNGVIQFP
jgi:exopolysaccharide biosynthesis protein